MKYNYKFFILMLITLLILTGSVHASNLNDTNTELNENTLFLPENVEATTSNEHYLNNGNFDDIQKAVNNAKSGDSIKLNGNFTSNGRKITIDKNLTIISDKTAVLDGNKESSIFDIKTNANGLTISNIIFKNGYNPSNGGAIFVDAKHVTIQNCSFINNQANNAGGALFTNQNVTEATDMIIKDCTFIENIAASSAGAVGMFGENSKILNCIFESNSAIILKKGYGGGAIQVGYDYINTNCLIYSCTFINNFVISSSGIKNHGGAGCVRNGTRYVNCIFINNSAQEGGALTFHTEGEVRNCTFINNTAEEYGGAISTSKVFSELNLTITDSYFEGNSAPYGGAIQLDGTRLEIKNSVFKDNYVDTNGGAVDFKGDFLLINNSYFDSNAGEYGGSINVNGSSLIVNNSTFNNNTGDYGGAIFINKNSTSTITSSDFTNNRAINGSAIYNNGTLSIFTTSFNNNLAESFNLTSNNASVKKGEDIEIYVKLKVGDNLANAIYSTENITLDGKKANLSPFPANQEIFLVLNNETYSSFTDKNGIAKFIIDSHELEVGNYTYYAYHPDSKLYTLILCNSTIEVKFNPDANKTIKHKELLKSPVKSAKKYSPKSTKPTPPVKTKTKNKKSYTSHRNLRNKHYDKNIVNSLTNTVFYKVNDIIKTTKGDPIKIANYNIIHIPGYSDFAKKYPIAAELIDWGIGLDEKGDMSLLDLAINILSLIPGGALLRGGKTITKVLKKSSKIEKVMEKIKEVKNLSTINKLLQNKYSQILNYASKIVNFGSKTIATVTNEVVTKVLKKIKPELLNSKVYKFFNNDLKNLRSITSTTNMNNSYNNYKSTITKKHKVSKHRALKNNIVRKINDKIKSKIKNGIKKIQKSFKKTKKKPTRTKIKRKAIQKAKNYLKQSITKTTKNIKRIYKKTTSNKYGKRKLRSKYRTRYKSKIHKTIRNTIKKIKFW